MPLTLLIKFAVIVIRRFLKDTERKPYVETLNLKPWGQHLSVFVSLGIVWELVYGHAELRGCVWVLDGAFPKGASHPPTICLLV